MNKSILKTNGNGGITDVGAWFVTYNTESMWANNFGAGHPIQYRALMPDGSYGIPYSDSAEVVDFQLAKLAEAKIDFILFDITNGGLTDKIPYGTNHNEWIVDNAAFTCERIALWNESHNWKIRYAIGVGSYMAIRGYKFDKEGNMIKEGISIGEITEMQAEEVYKKFVQNPVYGKDYYTLDGKPLLIIHDWGENVLTVPHGWNAYKGDRTYGDLFTVRNGQGGEAGTYGWQTRYGTQVHPEVEVVCPGQNTHGGRVNIYRNNGKYYRNEWNTVLSNPSPRIVMITSFNDYNEDSAIFPADTSGCEEGYEEKWTDENGVLCPNMYWEITCESIKKMREKNGDSLIQE